VKPLLKGKLGRVLLPLLLVTIFVVLPLVSIGAIWVQHVALLPGTAVVFPSDAAAMDRFMAAALKPYYGDRAGVCDGTNDHVEIRAALDAVSEVRLSEGTFNCEVTVDLDSDQTLRGCGRNTILATTTADLIFLSAVGGAGSELTGIIIADLQIDGGAGTVSDVGIYFEYVDYSFIQNVYSRRHDSATGTYLSGIYLLYSDFNIITGNLLRDNGESAIWIDYSDYNTITTNICEDCTDNIYIDNSSYNTVIGNVCQNGDYGILLGDSDGNTITGNSLIANVTGIRVMTSNENTVADNIAQMNNSQGIDIYYSNDNAVTGNMMTENSQATTNTYDDIRLYSSDYNTIQDNTCRAGSLANVPRYGIHIDNGACDENLVIDNDLSGGGWGTAPFNDDGTGTKLNTYCAPFSSGSEPIQGGFRIDAGGENAFGWLRLPDKVTQVVRMKIYAMSIVAEADHMRGDFNVAGAADNEIFNTHDGSIANHPSTSSNFGAGDIIYWTITTAGVLALSGGDSITVEVAHEAAGNGDCATDAYLRTVEIEYVS
jgi:parallel beta-helix repeat protein